MSDEPQYRSMPEAMESVGERGFWIHAWISPEELAERMKLDYVLIVSSFQEWYAFVVAWAMTWVLLYAVPFIGGGWHPFSKIPSIPFLVFDSPSAPVLPDFISKFPVVVAISVSPFLAAYAVIFAVLTVKMLGRSYDFSKFSNLTFTDTHAWAAGIIVPREEMERHPEFLRISKAFAEKPGEVSGLSAAFARAERKVFERKRGKSDRGWYWSGVLRRLGEKSGFAIVALLHYVLLRAFFAFWLAFEKVLSVPFVAVSRIAARIRWGSAFRINALFDRLDSESAEISEAQAELAGKLAEAGEWVWETGSNGVSKRLESVGKLVAGAIVTSSELKGAIKDSKYSEAFDFRKFDGWIRGQLGKPVAGMLGLLRSEKAKLERQFHEATESSGSQALVQSRRLSFRISAMEMEIGKWETMEAAI